MRRNPPIEEEPWWPDVLRLLDELAQAGTSLRKATKEVAERFPVHAHTVYDATRRGSVPAYPPRDAERASAWADGETRYHGRQCRRHGTRERYTNDGRCVQCREEERR